MAGDAKAKSMRDRKSQFMVGGAQKTPYQCCKEESEMICEMTEALVKANAEVSCSGSSSNKRPRAQV